VKGDTGAVGPKGATGEVTVPYLTIEIWTADGSKNHTLWKVPQGAPRIDYDLTVMQKPYTDYTWEVLTGIVHFISTPEVGVDIGFTYNYSQP
jgi:hypothetical protein